MRHIRPFRDPGQRSLIDGDIDTHRTGLRVRDLDENGDCILVLWILHDHLEAGRCWNQLFTFDHAGDMKGESLAWRGDVCGVERIRSVST